MFTICSIAMTDAKAEEEASGTFSATQRLHREERGLLLRTGLGVGEVAEAGVGGYSTLALQVKG